MNPKIYFILFLILAISCKEKNSYTLSGSFNGEPSEEWIYMVKFLDDYSNRDSAKIENGKFEFKGTVDVPEVYAFHYRMEKISGVATGFIEPGNLNLKIDLDNWELNSKITGGKINEEFNSFESARIEKFMKPTWALNQKRQTAGSDEKKIILDSLKILGAANAEFEMEYVNNHLSSPISLFLLFRNQSNLNTEEKGIILSKLDSSLHKTIIYKSMIDDIQNQIDIINQKEEIIQTVDIQLFQSHVEGESLLNQLIQQNPNKVLYIDVWGTWCGPCKKEFPFSRKLYDNISHDKIQMIYLCVSSPIEEWKLMVKSEELKGQHFLISDDDMKKFETKNEINIQGIPTYIIVGKDGKIIDKNAPRPSSEGINDLLAQLAK